MAVTVVMPKIGITVETCIIGSWSKKAGDAVKIGDVLFNYETDKAAFDYESAADGTLLEVFYRDGDEVPVLAPVCVIGEPDENVQAALADKGAAAAQNENGAPESDNDVASASIENGTIPARQIFEADKSPRNSGAASDARKIKISPRARSLAERLGVDYRNATPSGPDGRIIERDVEALINAALSTAPLNAVQSVLPLNAVQAIAPLNAAQSVLPLNAANAVATSPASSPVRSTPQPSPAPELSPSPASAYTDEKLPKIRRVISETMLRSLTEMAQITHHHSFDATRILALRADFKRDGSRYGLDGVTVGDIILFAVSRALPQHPDFNAHLLGADTLRRFSAVNLGVAIDTKRGLMVPTIFGADKKSLRQISSEVKELAQAARSGSISPDALSGGTFTVSNLGAAGVESFTPIINPPQVAILGVCCVTTRVREAPGGGVAAYPAMGLSLTYDHRVVDGAPASAFALELCRSLEHIDLLLSA